jgi:hypothetical protein
MTVKKMATVLFDSKKDTSVIISPSSSFSIVSLFDDYLTEPTSYPQFSPLAYLTENSYGNSKTPSNALFSSNSLFDGYLIGHFNKEIAKKLKLQIKYLLGISEYLHENELW